jgi:hypothetical protein
VYILRQNPGDTMVLDTVEGHQNTRRMLAAFLEGQDQVIEVAAKGRCHLDPSMEPLWSFRMRKTQNLIDTQELPGGILQVSGRPELLARYIEAFDFEPGVETDHHHPEQRFMGELDHGSAHIIIEADDEAGDAPGTP